MDIHMVIHNKAKIQSLHLRLFVIIKSILNFSELNLNQDLIWLFQP